VEREPEVDDQGLAILEEAEEILDESAPEIISEVEQERGDDAGGSFRSQAVTGTERDAGGKRGVQLGRGKGSRWHKPWKKA
jgi:ectoine hydroxylase-related dioxygenase (phytanoyl-CoA dioxygenase family)